MPWELGIGGDDDIDYVGELILFFIMVLSLTMVAKRILRD